MEPLKGMPLFTSIAIGTMIVSLLLPAAAPCQPDSCPLPLKTGKMTEQQIYRQFPEWKDRAARYTPKDEVVRKLRRVATPIEIVLFFGTWCKDVNDDVPRILKIFSAVGNAAFSLQIYAVDRRHREKSGFAEKLRINRVPTVVLLEGGKELGRIVEKPQQSLEEDLYAIVAESR